MIQIKLYTQYIVHLKSGILLNQGGFLCNVSLRTKEALSANCDGDLWDLQSVRVTLLQYCYRHIKPYHLKITYALSLNWPIGYEMIHTLLFANERTRVVNALHLETWELRWRRLYMLWLFERAHSVRFQNVSYLYYLFYIYSLISGLAPLFSRLCLTVNTLQLFLCLNC